MDSSTEDTQPQSTQANCIPEGKLMFQVKEPINTFTGRKEFLQQLHDSIQECRKKEVRILSSSQTSVITGPGGIGKSETVRMYIKQFSEEYDNIVWIDAEHPSDTTEQFKSLADQKLNIRLKDQDDEPQKFTHILEEVYEKLCQKPKRLLIVFDNAQDLDHGIHKFLPQKTTIEPPIVLVTSRQKYWKDVNTIELGLWDHEECTEYIFKRLKLKDTPENRKDANKLAALFDSLPIAVQLAVSVILEQPEGDPNVGRPNYSIQNLIYDYSRRKPDLRENEQPIPIQEKIQKLLDVSFDKLTQYNQGQLATRILTFMAYLSPTKIPKMIINSLFPETNKLQLDNALVLLTRYSFIQSFGNYFTIHRVIQEAIIRKLPTLNIPRMKFIPKFLLTLDEITILRQITNKLVANMSLLQQSTEDDKSSLITNMIHTTEYIIQHSLTSKFHEYIGKVAAFLLPMQFDVGIKLCMTLVDSDIKVNKWPPKRVFNNLAEIGHIYYNKGRFASAFEMYTIVLYGGTISNEELFNSKIVLTHGLETVPGAFHPYTLKIKTKLALSLSNQGKMDEALKIHYVVLEAREKLLGANHPQSLASKSNIAMCLSDKGQKEEALKLLYDVLDEQEKVLGVLHNETLITKNNIAVYLNEQGKYEEALNLYYTVLQGREEVFGPLHLNTLTTKNNIANCLLKQGKTEEALKMFDVVLQDHKNVFGALHQQTLTVKSNFAVCLSLQGQKEEALKLHHAVLEAREKVFGTLHPDTLKTKNNIAKCLSDLGQQEEALKLFNTLLEEQEKVLGALHPLTLITKNNVAKCLSDHGKKDEAIKLDYVVLEAQEKVFGALHPQTLVTKSNIASCHSVQGQTDEALKHYYAVLEAKEKVVGALHPDTLIIKKNIATCHRDQGQIEVALEFYYVVLEAQEKSLGALHPDTLNTKHSIAWCLGRGGKIEEALSLFYVVLEGREKVLGSLHPDTINTKRNIANRLYDQGKKEDALNLFKTLLEEHEKVLGPLHPETLIVKKNLRICTKALNSNNELYWKLHFFYKV